MRDAIRSKKIAAVFLLVLVTAIWGSTFVVVKDAVSRMPVMDFLGLRFALATLVLLAVKPKSLGRLKRGDWGAGAVLGLLLGVSYVTQTYGLTMTSAAVSGFITGMFVVFTPIIAGVILRRRIGPAAWIAVVLATAGLGIISLKGFSIGYGELLTLACAVFYAFHIVGLGEWSAGRDPFALAIVQLFVTALACSAFGAAGGFVLPPDLLAWGAVLVTAIFASAFAFVVQTWAQAFLAPTRTAIILTMEPVFAGLFAVLIGGEVLGWRILVGGALVIAAMYLAELGPRRGKEAEVPHLEV